MSDTTSDIDPMAFRQALGSFATGITVVTCLDAQGEAAGMTASSFNSVSLEPPLVLWSLGKTARCYEAFMQAQAFAIHVLTAEQQALSDRFASKDDNKFEGLTWAAGAHGVPVLPDCAALFECELAHQYAGGDHVILVGEVKSFSSSEHAPLLFHAGKYAQLSG